MKKKVLVILLISACLLTLAGCGKKEEEKPKEEEKIKTVDSKTVGYNEKLVKLVNEKNKDNYLISPYSIEIALNMLKDGANGNSRDEIENVIGTREIPVFTSKNRISVVNGTFIKSDYKDYIEKSYYDKLNSYKAELIFDEFKTPDKINAWVKENTYEMIPKILDEMDDEFVLGLANAVAIDVNWYFDFKCENTRSHEFTKTDGTKMNTEMMFNSFNTGSEYYFEIDGAKGVVIPYESYDSNGEIVDSNEENTQLEFVGILPDGTVNEFVSNLKDNQLKEIDVSKDSKEKYLLHVNIPRFAYDYKLEEFKDVLNEMGIKDVFDAEKADLTKMMTKENMRKLAADSENLYVSTAIHQTYIDLNEKGTKAAAVTYFGIGYATSSIPSERPTIKTITFDKPFVYMIRDSKTKEILFFGVVETPNEWKGKTCSNEE